MLILNQRYSHALHPRHFTVDFQPTRQDAGTNKLAITQFTLWPVLFTKDLDTLTLNKARTEHNPHPPPPAPSSPPPTPPLSPVSQKQDAAVCCSTLRFEVV